MRQRDRQNLRQGLATVPLAGYQKAKELVRQVSGTRRIRMESLVIVRRGGVINGTWMHSEVAVAYAKWLSPRAGEWCGARVKEIMRAKITK